jgi:carboxylate-amine ligase
MNHVIVLPHLLAFPRIALLGQPDAGLSSLVCVFDNMPRTGLPDRLTDWAEWQHRIAHSSWTSSVGTAPKSWWDLRPSDAFPHT